MGRSRNDVDAMLVGGLLKNEIKRINKKIEFVR